MTETTEFGEPRTAPPRPKLGRRARDALSWLARRAADIVVPPVCLECRMPLGQHDALCGGCWGKIAFIRPPLCDRLGIPMPYDAGGLESGGVMLSAAAVADPPAYDRARAVAHYDGVMRRLAQGLKYADRHDARRLFGRWLADAGAALLADADAIVPVPLGRGRLLMRRFNQAAILAGEVARITGKSFEPLWLVRQRNTPTQVGLTRDQRRRNVAGAFAVPAGRRDEVRGRHIVLIDDVVTTGATVEACARVLKRAGAARVDVLALALVTDRVRASV